MTYKLLALTTASIIGLTSTFATQADTLGFRFGASNWSQDYEGEILSSSNAFDELDLNNDLGFGDDNGTTIFAALEHPIPFIPNILVKKTELKLTAKGSPSKSFTFDDQTYTGNEKIVTSSDLSHTDIVLYYEILDNWVSLDLGIAARSFDQGFELKTEDGALSVLEVDATFPMLYLAAKTELPLTGLFLTAELSGISYGDASMTDFKVGFGYESDYGLGIEAGVRNFDIDYDDGDEKANLTIEGTYIALFYHF